GGRGSVSLPQPPKVRINLRAHRQAAAAVGSHLAETTCRNAVAYEGTPGSHRRDNVATPGFCSRLLVCLALSSVRRVPRQRECEPPGSHATRGKKYRRDPGRLEP